MPVQVGGLGRGADLILRPRQPVWADLDAQPRAAVARA